MTETEHSDVCQLQVHSCQWNFVCCFDVMLRVTLCAFEGITLPLILCLENVNNEYAAEWKGKNENTRLSINLIFTDVLYLYFPKI